MRSFGHDVFGVPSVAEGGRNQIQVPRLVLVHQRDSTTQLHYRHYLFIFALRLASQARDDEQRHGHG